MSHPARHDRNIMINVPSVGSPSCLSWWGRPFLLAVSWWCRSSLSAHTSAGTFLSPRWLAFEVGYTFLCAGLLLSPQHSVLSTHPAPHLSHGSPYRLIVNVVNTIISHSRRARPAVRLTPCRRTARRTRAAPAPPRPNGCHPQPRPAVHAAGPPARGGGGFVGGASGRTCRTQSRGVAHMGECLCQPQIVSPPHWFSLSPCRRVPVSPNSRPRRKFVRC